MARADALMKIQKTLVNRRAELRKRLGGNLDDLGFGQSSSPTGDTADAAFESTGDELSSQLAELEAKELAQIEHALRKIKQGSYGKCAGCETKIPVARLNIVPYCVTCIKCAREAEKDSTWGSDRFAGDWASVRDISPDREVNLADIEMGYGK